MNDPRNIPERLPGESLNRYCKRLNGLPLKCACGCGRAVKATTASFISYGRPPQYTRKCQSRSPERRKISSQSLKKQWKNPKFRKNYYSFWADYWHDPVRRSKRLKHTISKELKQRYRDPELQKWIDDHAQELDQSPDIQSEAFLDQDRFFEMNIIYVEDHRISEEDFEDSSLWDHSQIGFYNLIGDKVNSLIECLP